ncbi:MAG: hypothetical protein AB7P07_01190 [Hyphomonadaceae bacterium]
MFVGHYAAAMAAKAAAPKAPMWALAGGCQLVDIAWSLFIMTGVERARIDPTLAGSTLVLEHMPWTHSLPMSAAWAVAAGLVAFFLLRLPVWASGVIGLAVLSHWFLDFLVHRPDLELWVGAQKVGLGLWDYPVPEQALEIGLIAVAGAAWAASRVANDRYAWPALAFIAFLVAVQVLPMLMPAPEAGPVGIAFAAQALLVYIIVAGVAALTDVERQQVY